MRDGDRLIERLIGCWLLVVVGVFLVFGDMIFAELEPVWRDLDRSHAVAIQQPLTPSQPAETPPIASQAAAVEQAEAGPAVFIRIFKQESQLELWQRKGAQFEKTATFPICRWSGTLGPKLKEGDRQSPEGFYTVDIDALNPKSREYRAFNLGFPNLLERTLGRTGSLVMVHGGCASIGCFAMTHAGVNEIWKHVTTAFSGGQKRFQVQVFPFRMSASALQRHARSKWSSFWREMKPAYDVFETSRIPPRVQVCQGHYTIAEGLAGSDGSQPIDAGCPTVAMSEI